MCMCYNFFFFFFLSDTVPEEQIFKVLLGPFCADVALINITFSSEVLSSADCIARGLKIQEHMSPKSCSKVFTLEVPFADRNVQQMVGITEFQKLNVKNGLFCS